ncbi:MAG: hypothetical protein ACOYPR_16245, partial [Saprospiraceae bacterium]
MQKSIFFPAVCSFILSFTSFAQAQSGKPFRVGFQTQELKGDFGLGLSLDIPLPVRGFGLRLVGNNHWLEIPGDTDNHTVAFQTIRVGLAPDGWPVGEKIRVYGEGGALFIVPNDAMSPDDFVAGGYGVFGFEFYTKSMFGSSIFIEAGGCSTGV